jgi:hypothetical protein
MKTEVPGALSVLYNSRVLPPERAGVLARLVEENKDDFVDGGCHLPHQWPEGFDQFNWLQTSLGDEIVPAIQAALEELGYSRGFTAGCWASIYRPGEWIDSHQHSSTESPDLFISGTLCLRTVEGFKGLALGLDGPGHPWTWMEDEPGRLLLFPSNLIHGTNPNPGPGNRVTLNFDLYPDGIRALDFLIEDSKRYVHYAADASLYSLPELSLLDSERPPCSPTIQYD